MNKRISNYSNLFSIPFKLLLFSSTLLFLAHTTVVAQSVGDNWGIGIQLGQPAGISIKKHNSAGMSADILLAWDLDDFFFVNLHGVWEKDVSGANGLYFVYGPGVFAGFRERNRNRNDDDELFLGISGTFGLSYYIDQFEIYLRLTPRLAVIESTDGDVGGGLGFRFFFN
ncbi:MAG: hypothetical protein HRU41_18510 [Saprospiraceae bacterium]|nr:hypothetical protein [Saprospiraceae bacterium]